MEHRMNFGFYVPTVSNEESAAKAEAYNEWKRTLDEDNKKTLRQWELALTRKIKNFGDQSAAELISEILLRERKARRER